MVIRPAICCLGSQLRNARATRPPMLEQTRITSSCATALPVSSATRLPSRAPSSSIPGERRFQIDGRDAHARSAKPARKPAPQRGIAAIALDQKHQRTGTGLGLPRFAPNPKAGEGLDKHVKHQENRPVENHRPERLRQARPERRISTSGTTKERASPSSGARGSWRLKERLPRSSKPSSRPMCRKPETERPTPRRALDNTGLSQNEHIDLAQCSVSFPDA